MDSLRKRIETLTSPRALMGLVLALGTLAGQGGRGTMAYFTSYVASSSQAFQAGTLTATSSTFGTGTDFVGTSFNWSTTAAGSNCLVLNESDTTTSTISTQGLAPGGYCFAQITLKNTGDVDAWGRLRFVNTTSSTTDTTASLSLLNKLVFFMTEYDTATNQTAACANGSSSTYRPNGRTATATITGGTGAQTALTNVPGTGLIVGTADDTSGATHGASRMNLSLTSYSATPVTESTMTTAGTSSYFNLIGNSAANAGPNADFLVSAPTRYFCAALFLPSDTSLTASNKSSSGLTAEGDNTVQGANASFALHFVLAQKSGRP